jgi:hypothetical protein
MRGSRPASLIGVRRLAVVFLAGAAALAIAACGGAATRPAAARSATPAQLGAQTVGATGAITSGHIDVSLAVTLAGVTQLDSKPIVLDLSGPFARTAGGGLSTDLTLTISAASTHAVIGLDIVDGAAYIELGGTFYRLGSEHLPSGASGPSGASAPAGASGASGPLGAGGPGGLGALLSRLGIDPRTWLTDPHLVGTVPIGGVPTEHLTAQVDVANVLDDLTKLLPGGAAIASGATGASSPLVSALTALESAITSAQIDIYTGVADHIVRRVALSIAFTVPAIAAGALDGLTGGSLDFVATLTELGAPQTITVPADARPESKLLNGVLALESEFGSLAPLTRQFGGVLGLGGASGAPIASAAAAR